MDDTLGLEVEGREKNPCGSIYHVVCLVLSHQGSLRQDQTDHILSHRDSVSSSNMSSFFALICAKKGPGDRRDTDMLEEETGLFASFPSLVFV